MKSAMRTESLSVLQRVTTMLVAAVCVVCFGTESASATAIVENPLLEAEGPGLNYGLAGIGMRDKTEGTIFVPFDGLVTKLVLYWGGRGELPGDPSILMNNIEVQGDLIGAEDTTVNIAYAYRADVSTLPVITTAEGLFVTIKDASPGGTDKLNGASLLVYYFDGSSDVSRIFVYEGSDFAWAPLAPHHAGLTDAAVFTHGADVSMRNANLGIVAGDATPGRPDRVEVSGNPDIVNQLDGSDNPEWDSDIYDIMIPAGAATTSVRAVSPPEFGGTSDSLHWILAVMRLTEAAGEMQGACCLADGSCVETSEPNCDSLGGTYQGDNIPCQVVTCPQPEGACCLGDGSCIETTEASCTSQGGAYQGNGTECATTPCPGACCLAFGTCTQQRVDTCLAQGGVYQGFGSTCAQVVCPQPGACCLPTGACVQGLLLDGLDCIAQGGTYQGDGTSCSTAQCSGACCLADGTCVDTADLACVAQGGVYQGLGTNCATTPCPGACCLVIGTCTQQRASTCAAQGGVYQGFNTNCAQIECPQAGACCLPSGVCTQGLLVDGLDCTVTGGTYQGNDTTCETVQCLGACCLSDGSCIETTATACAAQGGAYQGLGSSCDTTQCLGACCLPDGFCFDSTAFSCGQALGIYQGFATTCTENMCPTPGACCFDDGSCLQAANVDGNDCDSGGGIYQGTGTSCDDNPCPQPGACCLDDGSCVQAADISGSDCIAQGGMYQGVDTNCADVNCSQPGACCLDDGSCVQAADISGNDCIAQGGVYEGAGTLCADVTCPQPGVCCLLDGSCVPATDLAGTACDAMGAVYQGVDTTCDTMTCPQPGACCLLDGSCIMATTLSGNDCFDVGGEYMGVDTTCLTVDCTQPGACCLPDGSCIQSTEKAGADCTAIGGTYQGDDTDCGDVACPQPPPPGPPGDDRVDINKGSLLIFSVVEIRWDKDGKLIQDTFVDIANDYPEDVRVQMYFINGDEPLEAYDDERAHPGWNHVSVEITLTKNQPTYWSAYSGYGGTSVAPFTVLDQDQTGTQPGRPDPEGTTDRVLRGYIVAWAVDSDNEEIRWNHLKGDAIVINYRDYAAWEYQAWSFAAQSVEHGAKTGTPGELLLDGDEYAYGFSQLLFDFYTAVATPFENDDLGVTASVSTDLTLHPITVDLRQEDDGPVTTKAKIDVWNQNEVKFNGTERCITCWDQRLIDQYTAFGVPNNFLLETLQTDKAKARIDGIRSDNCDYDYDVVDGPLGIHPFDIVSEDASLLGVAVKYLRFSSSGHAAAGFTLTGMGTETGVIRYDQLFSAPEASSPGR